MVEFKLLETFVQVAAMGNFHRAAARLNTTQPAISQRIAQLEHAVGHRLLERDRRSVGLTAHGRELHEHAIRLLAQRDAMLMAVSGPSAVSGLLRIGASETIAHTWLPQLMREASVAFPRLSLEIEVDISIRLQDRLAAREIELAFMVGPVGAMGIRSRSIASYPVAFVAGREITFARRRNGGRITLDELADWPIVTFSRRTKPFEAVEQAFRRVRTKSVRLHSSASLATAVKLAMDGLCIAAIPPAIVSDRLRRGELRVLKTEAELPSIDFDAAWHANNTDHAVEAIIAIAERVATGR